MAGAPNVTAHNSLRISGITVVVVAALSATSCSSPQGCNYSVINHESHSSLAQHYEVNVQGALAKDSVPEGPAIELQLITVQVEFPKPGTRAWRVFYALTDSGGRYLSSGTCALGLQECSKMMIDAARAACHVK
jgi:hypothetical protein